MNGIIKNRLPLLLLAIAVIFKIFGVLLHHIEAPIALDFFCKRHGGYA